jgi:hypothetical protein
MPSSNLLTLGDLPPKVIVDAHGVTLVILLGLAWSAAVSALGLPEDEYGVLYFKAKLPSSQLKKRPHLGIERWNYFLFARLFFVP